jgi:hypothetical protein
MKRVKGKCRKVKVKKAKKRIRFKKPPFTG